MKVPNEDWQAGPIVTVSPAMISAPASGGRPLTGAKTEGAPFSEAVLATPVLIVEDEMLIAWRLSDLFEDLGFTDIRTAADYRAAVDEAEDARPGLLICDVNLGGGPDGVETAAKLRGRSALPVIFITGYAAEEIAERVQETAPDAELLRKPIETERLIPALRRCLEQTRH